MHRSIPVFSALVLGSVLAWADEAAPLPPPNRPIEQAIDHHVDALLKADKVTPAPPADDATIIRRLTLDLVGRIPTTAETTAYLASTDPQKKAKLVERLMAAPGFVRHQATELNTVLQSDEPRRRGAQRTALREYLVRSLSDNRSWDKIFRDLLLPDETDDKMKGANEFLKTRVKDVNRLTIDVSTIFFGVNVSCAQCHDHPHVHDWKQDHFYGLKSFFARTIDNGGFLAERDFGVVKYIPNKGKEKEAPVMFLTGKTIAAPGLKEPTKDEKKAEQERLSTAKKAKKAPAPPRYSLRAKLVETALEPGQREFFARAIVNRLWHRHFGRGLVMPLDQMHSENAPSHPELLQWLARDLVEHGYDLRRVIRGIVLSNAYARGSRWEGDRQPADKYFAMAQVRPLTPMQMAVSMKLASMDQKALSGAAAEVEKRLEALEKSAEGLARHFPQPGDNFQVSVSEAMLFANNEALQKELLEGNERLPKRLLQEPDLMKRADLANRGVLCRPARAEEKQAIAAYLQERQDRPEAACQHVVWALLTSAEFRFNH
ncbi:MAG: DUF1549 and DUF1553 domain-containing protein [Gemmataceae bacterium]|nr:DUF1549 and DUF1553 domain-containing protein [Gemmataceae bacterium]